MNVTQRVENIMKASKPARNSDTELLLIYMQKSGMELSEGQMAVFRRMASPETIRRTRQKLQEAGKYPADPEVDEARFNKFQQVKQNINYDSVEDLLASQGKVVLPWGQ